MAVAAPNLVAYRARYVLADILPNTIWRTKLFRAADDREAREIAERDCCGFMSSEWWLEEVERCE